MKKILFMNSSRKNISLLWNNACQRKAEDYSFAVDIPAIDTEFADAEFQKILPDYDGVITTWGSPVCSHDFLRIAPQLQVIGHAAGSVAAICDDSTYETGVTILSANSVMAETVAEWSLMMALIAQRHLPNYAKLRRGDKMNWLPSGRDKDLRSTTIGIWGFGEIAKIFLRLIAPLNVGRVLVYSQFSSAEEITRLGAERCESFEQLLSQSDQLHCLAGMTMQNYRKIGAAELSLLHDGATLINAGRARLLDNDALYCEVKKQRINAILDVFEIEPLPELSPWYELDNAILTPHQAAGVGQERYVPFILDQMHEFFRGHTPQGIIDQKRFKSMTNEKIK